MILLYAVLSYVFSPYDSLCPGVLMIDEMARQC